MSEGKYAIRARHISKSYRRYNKNMQKIRYLLLMNDAGSVVEVLDDVSFDIKKGEKVGIIGQQLSGKSTLMRILAGVIRPDSGKVKTAGEVTAILDTRLGFDNNMTGLDNYNVMCSALGWTTKMIKDHEESVFSFAKLKDEKDEPIKTYKKGCASRLGFTIATERCDDIMLLDANFAFGGKAWNEACIKRLKELVSGDTTFIMCANKLIDAAKLCDRGIVIHKGKLVFDGPFEDAAEYFKTNCRHSARRGKKEVVEEAETEEAELASEVEESNDEDF